MKVGFIGLGNMGSAIARNLINAGHDLTVYNRTRSRAEPFAAIVKEARSRPCAAYVNRIYAELGGGSASPRPKRKIGGRTRART